MTTKYEYLTILQVYYYNKWEDEYCANNKKEVIEIKKDYIKSCPKYPSRIINRRLLIESNQVS